MRLFALVLIFVAGLTLRMDAAWQGAPVNQPDSAAYERIARGLHEEGRFAQKGEGTPAHAQAATNYSPGLPLAVAAVFEVAGKDDVRLARILLAIAGAIAIPLAWLLARRLAPPEDPGVAGLVAAATVAFYPCLIADAGMLLTESVAGTLIVAALLSILRAQEKTTPDSRSGSLMLWAVPGALLGVLTLFRPEYMLISIALTAVVLAVGRRQGIRPALKNGGAILAAMAIVIAPWAFWSYDQSGRVLPLSSGGGQTLFSGSYLPAAGDPLEVMPGVLARNPVLVERLKIENAISGEGPASVTPERAFTLLAAARMPGVQTDVALSQMARENYLRALHHDPIHLMGHLAGKSARVWWRGRTDLTGTAAGRAVHMTLVAAALIGLLLLGFRRNPAFWLVLTLALSVTVIGALFVASPRRTLALWPVIACLTGLGFSLTLRLARDAVTGRLRPVRIA